MIWRIASTVVSIAFVLVLGQLGWRALQQRTARPGGILNASQAQPAGRLELSVASSPVRPTDCTSGGDFAVPAASNADSLTTAQASPFGRPESGWEIYAPLISYEINTRCPPQSPGFAAALARWQSVHHPPASGVIDAQTLQTFKLIWLNRRPFVAATMHGSCPLPPSPDRLNWTLPGESFGSKPVQLRPAALAAYRAMIADARSEAPELAADHRLMTIFSGFRDPAGDEVRCFAGGCNTVTRASCSAHRTGLAVDLFLGSAPGYPPDSSADPNRLFQSRSAAYGWLVANAAHFGFVNYPFEPWHWEWTGEAP